MNAVLTSPLMNRRNAIASIAAVGAATFTPPALALEQGDTSNLDRLIAAYEEKEQTHVELLDLEDVLVHKYVVTDEDRAELHAAISAAIEDADNALLDVLAYVPANTGEAFAKARWMLAYKESVQGEWRDIEVRAIIASTTQGWMEV